MRPAREMTFGFYSEGPCVCTPCVAAGVLRGEYGWDDNRTLRCHALKGRGKGRLAEAVLSDH